MEGKLVADIINVITGVKRGPMLLEDFIWLEEMTHFNRERIVHAKGANDISRLPALRSQSTVRQQCLVS